MGLAASPGTDVEPTCSSRTAIAPSAARRRSSSFSALGGPAIVVVDDAQRGVETIVEERVPLRRRVAGRHVAA